MAVDFANGSPLAGALQGIVQAKLTELGWLTSDDDTTLFDYILLMLANEKNEAQVATELSNDLLDLGPENVETQQFAKWLFEQIHNLRAQLADGNAAQNAQHATTSEEQMEDTPNDGSASAQDTEMDGVAEGSSGTIPTGPKAMRNGGGAKQSARRGGMIGQLNKQMNRNDDSALHRVRGSQGAGRINSHSREPPKGPRQSQNLGRGLEAMASGRGMGNANVGHAGMNGMNMGGMPMPPMGQGGMPGSMPGGGPMANGGLMNPQQAQMALLQMYEQQAHMMQQLFGAAPTTPFMNSNFAGSAGRGGRGGKKFSGAGRGSLQSNTGLPPSTKFTKKEGQDEAMADGSTAENGDGMEVESSRPDPSTTMCNFNQRCAKPDCPFVHSSPVAPRAIVVDMNDTCSFGAACKNKKCVGKHPSPAQRQKFQAEQQCMYYPNCRDQANCPYMHPTTPPCRNGPDCTTPGCKFWHTTTMCKFTPCTNPNCAFKHVEGQKQVTKGSNVWVAPKNGEQDQKDHVSQRKFIDETQPEELIIPDKPEMKNEEMAEAAL